MVIDLGYPTLAQNWIYAWAGGGPGDPLPPGLPDTPSEYPDGNGAAKRYEFADGSAVIRDAFGANDWELGIHREQLEASRERIEAENESVAEAAPVYFEEQLAVPPGTPICR